MIRYVDGVNPKLLRGTALLRLDFNTEDDWRMRAVLPTIKWLMKTSFKIVIASHRGRPAGVDKKFSLRRNATMLTRLLGEKVVFIPNFDFKKIKSDIENAPRGSIF